MNKAELITAVARDLGGSKQAAARAVNSVLETIRANAAKGVSLVGFGSFYVTSRKASKGIDPRNGRPIKIKACRIVRFKAGQAFKDGL